MSRRRTTVAVAVGYDDDDDDDDGRSNLHWRTKASKREEVVEIETDATVDDGVFDAAAVVLVRMDRRTNAVVAADIIVASRKGRSYDVLLNSWLYYHYFRIYVLYLCR